MSRNSDVYILSEVLCKNDVCTIYVFFPYSKLYFARNRRKIFVRPSGHILGLAHWTERLDQMINKSYQREREREGEREKVGKEKVGKSFRAGESCVIPD